MAKISQTAPAAEPSGGMSIAAGAEYSAPDHSDGAYSTEDVMALFDGEPGGDIDEDVADEPEIVEGSEGEVQQEAAEPVQEPDYPMPEGWEDAMWQGLHPEARGKVDALIKSHADAVSKHAGELEAMKSQTAQTLAKANAEAQQLLNFAREVIEGEFRNVDWQALKAQPELFVQAQDLFNGRRAALQQLQNQLAANAQAAQQQAMEQAKASLVSEWAGVEPKLKALMGADYSKDGYKTAMRDYLKAAGASDAEISSIGKGYVLEIATKAMLYDKFQSARDAAAAKVASAPAVQEPHGVASADGDGARFKAARAHLNKNPNSTEALAALFAAM